MFPISAEAIRTFLPSISQRVLAFSDPLSTDSTMNIILDLQHTPRSPNIWLGLVASLPEYILNRIHNCRSHDDGKGERNTIAEAEEGEKPNPRRRNRTARSDGELKEEEIWRQIQKADNREQEIPLDSRNRNKTMTSNANLAGSDTTENTIENEAEEETDFVFDEGNPHQSQEFPQSLKRQRTDVTPSKRASNLSKTALEPAVGTYGSQKTTVTPTIPYESKRKAGIEAFHKGQARADKVFEMRRRPLAQESPGDHSPHETPHLSSQDNASQTVKPVMGTKMKQQWWDGINTPEGEREHLRKLCKEAKRDRLRRKKESKK